jgi:flagellar biosynthesis protein FlhF
MELRKFYASNMREAMDLVRRELGEEAIILNAKSVRDAGAPGQQPLERVEVWAHLPELTEPIPETTMPERPAPPQATTVAPVPAGEAAAPVEPGPAVTMPPAAADGFAEQIQALHGQLDSVHVALQQLAGNMNWLGAGSLDGELAQCIADTLAQRLPVSGGVQLPATTASPRVVALVGPTGVGKTTVAMKLAWHYTVHDPRQPGIVTLDTQHIGAIDKLRRFCQYLDVPLEVVYEQTDVQAALTRLQGREIVLLDTPGTSPRNPERLAWLAAMLAQADPAEVHLVVNSGISPTMLGDVVQHFTPVHPDQLLVTKLDEAPSLVDLFPTVLHSGLAMSYLSAGQLASADLDVATYERLAQCLGKQ